MGKKYLSITIMALAVITFSIYFVRNLNNIEELHKEEKGTITAQIPIERSATLQSDALNNIDTGIYEFEFSQGWAVKERLPRGNRLWWDTGEITLWEKSKSDDGSREYKVGIYITDPKTGAKSFKHKDFTVGSTYAECYLDANLTSYFEASTNILYHCEEPGDGTEGIKFFIYNWSTNKIKLLSQCGSEPNEKKCFE